MENVMTEAKKCGCGRSTTGFCTGWHSLTNEQYLAKLNEQKLNETKQLLNE
jgi:CDGSH-type Zn-finger protein